MKKVLAATVLATAMMASPLAAQPFTYSIEFSEPDLVGGMGEGNRDGRSAIMTGPFTSTGPDGGSVSGTVKCIGMDQPDNGLFEVHFSCTATRDDGTATSLVYGCNWISADMGLSCVGGMEGKTGDLEGRRGVVTMHMREGTSVGTGQWIE